MEKRKKPVFKRTDWNRKPRFNSRAKKVKWRKAKGRDSKVRLARKGHGVAPTIGYRNPKAVRGLIKGMNPVIIHNASDLSKVGKDEIAIVSSRTGMKKKVEIANKSEKMNLRFLNFDPKKLLAEIQKKKDEKKKAQEKAKKEEKKDEKKEEKKAEEKKERKPKEDKK